MGSEGPSDVTIHITGFKKFYGVSQNPTETIVRNLESYLRKKQLPGGLVLGSCNVLETAGEGALVELYDIFKLSLAKRNNDLPNKGNVIWIHFGVNSGAARFAIENQAFNEATFRCPDELGWKPHRVPIVHTDGSLSRRRQTTLPVSKIVEALSKKGYDVMPSEDAGRFVCNFVYYHSLCFAEQNGIKSLFVHVPLFVTIDEETQMEFAASLLEVVASLH